MLNKLTVSFHQLRQDRVFTWCTRLTLLVLAASFLLLVFYWHRLPPQLPFFYSLPWGEEQLVSPVALPVLLLAVLGLYILNVFLANLIYPISQLFSRFLLLGGLFLNWFVVFSLLQIIFLVT